MKPSRLGALTGVLLAAVAVTGCGLKGALTMPSKSEEVVIRAPGQTDAPTDDTTATPPATPAEPTQETPAKKPRRDERIPPPPLPGGNPGTARGG
jgi:predicted small lipoprotein YifL